MRAIIAGALLLSCVGCAGPTFITRPVQDDLNLLVGLVSYNDQGKAALVRHDHPIEWSDTDLYAILTRLRVQTRGGLLDSPGPARPLFSPEESTHLLPGLREAFRDARPSDWVGFALWASSRKSQALEVTSGGMFLQDRRLHVILANHRERVVSEKDGITAIHSNPFHSLRDVRGTLMFDPASYVVDSRIAWMAGGFESLASELILDYEAFLANARLSTPAGAEGLTTSGNSGAGSP